MPNEGGSARNDRTSSNNDTRSRGGLIQDPNSDAYRDMEARQQSRSVGDGGGSSRVICTHFYRKGMMERDLWRADLEFTFQNLSARTVRGYQAWAIPYVRLMRKSPLAERIMYPLAYHRAKELSYQLGKTAKGSLRGKLVRLIGEPICFAIGLLVGEQDWESLWTQDRIQSKQ